MYYLPPVPREDLDEITRALAYDAELNWWIGYHPIRKNLMRLAVRTALLHW